MTMPAAQKQDLYARYRRVWAMAVGNPLPEPGSGPTRDGKAGAL